MALHLACVVLVLSIVGYPMGSANIPQPSADLPYSVCGETTDSVHNYQHTNLETSVDESMNQFNGSVLMVVNTASFCDYTNNQYRMMNSLSEIPQGKLKIAAFPCNQFDLGEPGENNEIMNGLKYVRPGFGFVPVDGFSLFNKLKVNGQNENAMYKFLKKTCPPPQGVVGTKENMFWDPIKQSDIRWNFEKFLIDKDGKPKYRIAPKVEPNQLSAFINALNAM